MVNGLSFKKQSKGRNSLRPDMDGEIPTSPGEKFEPKLVSTGTGRTTCAYFYPDGKHILYGSTHLANKDCPPVPDRTKYGNKYIWAVYEGFDIFKADTNGKIVQQLTK
jgi:hypothetical protein